MMPSRMDVTTMSYKQLHESFMQNHNGTSVEDTISIQTPLPILIFLSVFITNCIIRNFGIKLETNFMRLCFYALEIFLLIVVQVAIYTLPLYRSYVSLFLYIISFWFVIRIVLNYLTNTIAEKSSTVALRKTVLNGKRPYITYFRTSVNLTTTICILAVDFTVFPRALSKTETYGFSLMDTGVGYFIVCNGLVGIRPNNSKSNVSRLYLVLELMRKNISLLVLGLARFVTVNSIDYQQHTSEYGVHWNFFVTLAFTKIVATLVLTFINKSHVKYLALGTASFHQMMLSFGVEKWVLSDLPRDTFLLANREGLSSLLGYVSLYLVSVELGSRIRAKESLFEKDLIRLGKLFVYTILFYILVTVLNMFFECSRRLANVTYIAWIIMLTLYILFLCLFFELLLRLYNGPNRIKDNVHLVPSILMSIDFNPLPYFLGANLLTGLVNMCVQTLYVNQANSILIIISYMLILCSITLFLFVKNIKLPC